VRSFLVILTICLLLLSASTSGLQGATGSPDCTDQGQTAKDTGLGALVGALTGATVPLAGKIASPFSIASERQALVDALTGAGVPVSAGQRVGSEFVRGLEAGGIGAKGFTRDQGQAFSKALLDQAGIPATNATQESIAAAKTQIGKMFTELGGRNTLMLDDELRQRMQTAVANYKRLGGTSPGVEAAAEAEDAAWQLVEALTKKIRETPAKTFAGLAVKARALRFDTHLSTRCDLPPEDQDWPEQVMNELVAEIDRLAAAELSE
jgi:hypothetical protein